MIKEGTKIEVTREDIDLGERGIHDSCPVALALKKAVPDAVGVSAGGLRVVFDNTTTLEFSNSLADWIAGFDVGDNVQPITLQRKGDYIRIV